MTQHKSTLSHKEVLTKLFANDPLLPSAYLSDIFSDPESTEIERTSALSEVVEILGYIPEINCTNAKENS